MDSSRADVCSGEVPFLDGNAAARDSFSTYGCIRAVVLIMPYDGF